MAVEQKVVIRVEIDPDMSKAAAITAFTNTLEKRLGRTNKALTRVSNGFERGLGEAIGTTLRRLADFGKAILKLNFKGLALELGLVTVGLLAMKAALASGKAIMRAWDSTVSFARVAVAGLAGGVIALVSALAAANRQFSQMQLAPFIGGLQQARTALRAPMADAGLGVMGMQAITQAASTMGRAGISSNTTALMREMGNIASGDPKQFQAMAQAISQVKQTGSSAAGVDALKGMGPQFAQQAAAAGSMGADEFIKALASGELTPEAFSGQLDKLNNTLMGRFKGLVQRFYTQFADMGAIFLVPLTNALNDVEHIFSRTLFRVRGAIQEFGMETFIPGLVDSMETFTNWISTIIVRDLPRMMEVFGKIADWWTDFKRGSSRFFGGLGESMEKFSVAGEHAWTMVKNLFGEIGDFVKGRFGTWKDSIEETATAFEQFGTSLGKLIAGGLAVVTQYKDEFFKILPELNEFIAYIADEVFPVMADFASQFVKAFKSALPVITMVVSAFLPLLKVLNSLIGVIAELPGGLGGLAMLAGAYFGMTGAGRGRAGAFTSGFRAQATALRTGEAMPAVTGGSKIMQEAGRRFGGTRAGQALTAAGARGAANMRAGSTLFGSTPGAAASAAAGRGGGLRGFFGRGAAAAGPGAMVGDKTMDSQGRWRDANGRFTSPPPAAKGGMSRLRNARMGMGGGMAMAMGSMMIGSMIGGEGGSVLGQAGMMGSMGMMAGQGLSGKLGGPTLGLAALALTLGKGAWDAKTAKGGATLGVGAGAAAGAAIGTAIPIPVIGTLGGAIIGGLVGGIGGWIKGNDAEKKMAEAGEALATALVDTVIEGMGTAVGRDAIIAAPDQLTELLGNEDAMKAMATSQGVSYESLKSKLETDQQRAIDEVPVQINALNSSIGKLVDITGLSATQIEDDAVSMGIALQEGSKATNEFIRNITQDFADMGRAGWNDVINTATYDSWTGNRFATMAQENEASNQGRASTQALLEHLAGGGSMEDDVGAQLTDDWIASAMNQGQAQGLTGTALEDYMYKSVMGLEGANAQHGIESSKFDPLRDEASASLTRSMENFVNSPAVKALEMRGTTLGMEPNEIRAMVDRAFASGDAAGELAVLTEKIYSKAADSISRLGDEGEITAAEFVRMRNMLMSGELEDLDSALDPSRLPGATSSDAHAGGSQLGQNQSLRRVRVGRGGPTAYQDQWYTPADPNAPKGTMFSR